jgi:hypothetical protein
MKRVLFSIALFVLCVSGWGVVLADTFCPHKEARRSQQKVKPIVTQKRHASCHETQNGDASGTAALRIENEDTASFTGNKGPCSYCITDQESSTNFFTLALGTALTRRGDSTPVILPRGFDRHIASPFSPLIHARQHAPPGRRTLQRHVLLNVFLI